MKTLSCRLETEEGNSVELITNESGYFLIIDGEESAKIKFTKREISNFLYAAIAVLN